VFAGYFAGLELFSREKETILERDLIPKSKIKEK